MNHNVHDVRYRLNVSITVEFLALTYKVSVANFYFFAASFNRSFTW